MAPAASVVPGEFVAFLSDRSDEIVKAVTRAGPYRFSDDNSETKQFVLLYSGVDNSLLTAYMSVNHFPTTIVLWVHLDATSKIEVARTQVTRQLDNLPMLVVVRFLMPREPVTWQMLANDINRHNGFVSHGTALSHLLDDKELVFAVKQIQPGARKQTTRDLLNVDMRALSTSDPTRMIVGDLFPQSVMLVALESIVGQVMSDDESDSMLEDTIELELPVKTRRMILERNNLVVGSISSTKARSNACVHVCIVVQADLSNLKRHIERLQPAVSRHVIVYVGIILSVTIEQLSRPLQQLLVELRQQPYIEFEAHVIVPDRHRFDGRRPVAQMAAMYECVARNAHVALLTRLAGMGASDNEREIDVMKLDRDISQLMAAIRTLKAQ
jgi:hypothetical protein